MNSNQEILYLGVNEVKGKGHCQQLFVQYISEFGIKKKFTVVPVQMILLVLFGNRLKTVDIC